MIRYLTFVFIFFAFTESTAQSSRWILGVKPGIGWGGVSKTEELNRLETDQFKKQFAFSAAIRVGYQFTPFLSLVADPGWQYSSDRRIRTYSDTYVGEGPMVITTNYRNSFHQIQVPVAIQITPLPKITKTYLSVGLMPTFITHGSFNFRTTTSRPSGGVIDRGRWTADFDIPANKGLNKDLIFFTGLGTVISRHLSVEAVYQFNNETRYFLFDPGSTFIGVPQWNTKALRGLQFSVFYKIW